MHSDVDRQSFVTRETLYGLVFFLFHLSIEIVSYMLLYLRFGTYVSLLITLIYDFFAFVPQALIGDIHNKHKTWNLGFIGIIFFTIAILFIKADNDCIYLFAILLISFANAILHECGAIAVASVSKKNIFPSALFVSGGTMGIVIGRYFAEANVSINYLFIFIIIMLIILTVTDKTWCRNDVTYIDVNIVNVDKSKAIIFLSAFFVLIVRSFMGFVLPLAWKVSFFHTVLLSLFLGIGKAWGGYLCDTIGYKKVSFISTILCVPFIIYGNQFMFLSLIGIMLFSMTMSITYAMLLSIIKNNPGVAFGITTIGLFVGALPLLFLRLSGIANIIVIVVMSIISFILLKNTLT